jgi:hypothetical protein
MYEFISKMQVASVKFLKLLIKTVSTFLTEIVSAVPKILLDNVYLVIKWIQGIYYQPIFDYLKCLLRE